MVLQLKTKLTDYFVKLHNDLAAHVTRDQNILADDFSKSQLSDSLERQNIDRKLRNLMRTTYCIVYELQ